MKIVAGNKVGDEVGGALVTSLSLIALLSTIVHQRVKRENMLCGP